MQNKDYKGHTIFKLFYENMGHFFTPNIYIINLLCKNTDKII